MSLSLKRTSVILGVLLMVVVLAALIVPSMQSGRSGPRRTSQNNISQVGRALLHYDPANGRLPPAFTQAEAGIPLLSWRAAILPLLERRDLFRALKQDEPWNGLTNQRLIPTVISEYKSPGLDDRVSGETNVLGIVGPDTLLAPGEGIRFDEVSDGLSRTVMVVEFAGSRITWSEPRDVSVEEFVAAVARSPQGSGLRPVYAGGVWCVLGDGSVRQIPSDTPPQTLRALCTRSGGEQFTLPWKE